MKELYELFMVFARIGAFTFGGGYAMLPILQREVVDKRGWAKSEELMDYYAIGQCTPGIIAVNTATFIGYNRKGILGGFIATFGLCFPSLVIIILIAALISNFSDLVAVQQAFAGIRVCVVVLIFNAVVKLYKGAVKDKGAMLLFIIIFLLSSFTRISTVLFIVLAGISGLVINRLRPIKKMGGRE